ncbi:MAG: FtsX-like permease family protein [Bacteroidales bacterium]|nr:FtsX-like permease family protein [Bacteroidales bacterium]
MNVPLYIAKRYLFAKKSHNVINIISIISLIGVATGVSALVIVLSVFNGFDSLIKKMYSTFDAEIKVKLVEGKTFSPHSPEIEKLKKLKGVAVYVEILEENALFRYRERQHIGMIKGVSRNYTDLTGVDTMIIDGAFQLWRGSQSLAVMGQGVSYYLNANLAQFDPLTIYVPKRGKTASLSPENAFVKMGIMPSGVFAIEQEFDSQYVIIPIEFARTLLEYKDEVTSIELKAEKGVEIERLQKMVEETLGNKYRVLNRYQQNETLFRTMKSEKLAIGLILSLILVIASFNIIGSLSMLIIDKRNDVDTLRSMGADNDLIQKIFLAEGMLISMGGTIVGTLFGLLVCWLQIAFGLVKLQGNGNFIIDSYPVDIHPFDISIILIIVIAIGYLAARFPVRIITKRILNDDNRGNL